MRALIDTCIVIDALQNREGFSADAQRIFLGVANKWFVGFLSAKSVTDIYYLTHRYTHNDTDTCKILNTLFQLFEIMDTTGMDCIVTRNLKDYNKVPIPVYAPADFLKMVEPQEE